MSKKKKLLITFAFIFFSIVLLSAYLTTPLSHAKNFNVIWISLDTQRAQSLELYGYPLKTSPFLNEFGKKNIVFDKVLAQSTLTHTSHFSMLTGTYPSKHGVLTTDPEFRLNKKIKMVAEILKDKGYQTLISGVIDNNPFLNLDVGLGRGFDRFNLHDFLFPFSTENTLKHIQEMVKEKKPFFAFLHTSGVHAPYFPPPAFLAPYNFGYKGKIKWDSSKYASPLPNEKYRDTYDRVLLDFISSIDVTNLQDLKMIEALYNGTITFQDDNLRNFFSRLEKIIPNFAQTIIIITSDHGESLGEHGKLQHGNMSQENIWIPLIIHFPGFTSKRIATTVRSIDILPTLLDFLDIKTPQYIDGATTLPIIKGTQKSKHFTVAFTQKREQYAVFKNSWKLVSQRGNEDLYNLEKDPLENKNVALEYPDICFELRNELQDYQLKTPLLRDE